MLPAVSMLIQTISPTADPKVESFDSVTNVQPRRWWGQNSCSCRIVWCCAAGCLGCRRVQLQSFKFSFYWISYFSWPWHDWLYSCHIVHGLDTLSQTSWLHHSARASFQDRFFLSWFDDANEDTNTSLDVIASVQWRQQWALMISREIFSLKSMAIRVGHACHH